MEEYYYKTTGVNNDGCVERCMVVDNGTHIGSITCQACVHCVEHKKNPSTGHYWIKCEKLNEAKNGHKTDSD